MVADHDAYIAEAPEALRPLLAQLRAQLARTLPDAEEVIAYKMPGFRIGKSIIAGYAAFSKQCGGVACLQLWASMRSGFRFRFGDSAGQTSACSLGANCHPCFVLARPENRTGRSLPLRAHRESFDRSGMWRGVPS